MRNLTTDPITLYEIQQCLHQLSMSLADEKIPGDMRPLLLSKAMFIVLAAGNAAVALTNVLPPLEPEER